MRRNCNLELRLFPPFESVHRPLMEEEGTKSPPQQYNGQLQQQQQHQPLTIFYDGKMCVCDVTELQARSILMLAKKEMEERVRTPTGTGSSEPYSPSLQSPHHNLHSPATPGLAMTRSLQRFLQKRKDRIQEASP
ncbi:hypothetical protein RIF29_13757 [Crotalaria pallida]|uniref:Protein TIFY n=1 Tax=Crotalaria pallida TaxID=3830 RepID=A0AAN9IPY6_CROPI